MTIVKTRFEGYFIDDTTFDVFSNKRGVMSLLHQSIIYHTKRVNAKPYAQVGVKGCTLLHRLIADTFISSVEGLTVNHKDGNTLNNSISNLEVVTQKENWHHALATGLVKLGEQHGKAVYTDEFLLIALKKIQSGASVKSIANKYGITQSYLNKVKNKVYRAYLMESLSQLEEL